MKVYELAKKLKITSVFLMDKIRKEWKLPVKTHMEALTPELAKKIEEKFYASQKPPEKKSTGKKKKTSKKETDKKTTTTKKTSTKKKSTKKASAVQKKTSVSKKTTVKKQSVKKITEDSPLKKETEQQTTTAPQRKIIIRRKPSEEKKLVKISDPIPSAGPSHIKEDIPSPAATPLTTSKSIRSDLISVKTTDPLDESFWGTREETEPAKKQPKKPIVEKDVSSKFNATDFRKREVIFQPRKKRIALAGELKSTPGYHPQIP